MKRFRLVIAAVVAVAMFSVGAAACTPEQQTQVQTSVTAFFTTLFDLLVLSITCRPTPGCDG